MTKDTFEREMKKFDPLLRIRRSQGGQWWLIERKAARETKCVAKPLERRGWDRYIQDSQGYIQVARIAWNELNTWVFNELRARDMWAVRGAGWYADQLDAEEQKQEEAEERRGSQMIQDLSGEAYDKLRFMDGCQAGGFHSKVGGYEPCTN